MKGKSCYAYRNTVLLLFTAVLLALTVESKPSLHQMETIIIVTIVVFGMAFVVFISCCLSKNMRKFHQHMVQRMTIMIAQHHSQESQYSPYPAINLHPVYGLQPIPIGPTLGQQCAPGPASTYLEAAGQFPASFSQAAHDEDQIMYAPQAPLQPGLRTYYTLPQQLHNPDYVDSPKTS